MADVALFLLPLKDDDDEESSPSEIDFEEEIVDPSSPFWSPSVFDEEEAIISASPNLIEHHGLETLDLFERYRPPETLDTSDFRALDAVENPSDYLALDLGLGLGFGFDIQDEEDEEVRYYEDHPMDHGDGLRSVGFEFDSDTESDPDRDPSLPLCLDSLWLDDGRGDVDVDFEWEEVDVHIDESDILSMMVGEGEGSMRSSELDDEEERRAVEWEVLLATHDALVEEEGDFVNPSDYEILFGQFTDPIRGSPPAAKSVIENLPSVFLTQDDVEKNNTLCAVCKDEICLEEKAKRLPCMHHYHGECILPWLGMRNTCPVCRYELPTDDPDYESWRAQQGEASEERYDLDMFSAV